MKTKRTAPSRPAHRSGQTQSPRSPVAGASPVVLITGCSSGIGNALARCFHDAGFQVVATARCLDALQPLAVQGMDTDVLDVTNTYEIRQVVERVLAEKGRIDVLVNNAGYGLMAPTLDVAPAELRSQFHTNVFAPLELVQAVAPAMREAGRGLIINIGSVSGVVTTPFAGVYCASKAALHALSDALRMELAPFGIRVMTVQPGAIRSSFGDKAQAKAAQVLRTDSWYQTLADAVLARANLSQINSTPVEVFAQQLVRAAQRPSPPPVLRLGKSSRFLPLLKWILPTGWCDRLFIQKFGLTRLSRRSG
ncbi:MAG: SDR family oxidoreductase [Synechococcales bacterium]|nr:SDR family oxidoreductase [Synechococcales bacterium]